MGSSGLRFCLARFAFMAFQAVRARRQTFEDVKGCSASRPNTSPSLRSLAHPVLEEEVPKYGRDRHRTLASATLWLDKLACLRIVGPLYSHDAAREIHVLPPQSLDLARAEPP